MKNNVRVRRGREREILRSCNLYVVSDSDKWRQRDDVGRVKDVGETQS